jgi:hypothetical protein
MRVTLEQSGGFAGLMIMRTIDTQDLSPTETQQLEQLVKESDFFQLNSVTNYASQADRFAYQLTIEQDGRSHSVQVSEENIPAQLRPLMEWVQQNAR